MAVRQFVWPRQTPLLIPGVYDEALSYLERLEILWKLVQQLYEMGYVTQEEFDAYKEFMVSDQANQTVELKRYTDDRIAQLEAKLLKLINDIVVGDILIRDPTTGAIDNLQTVIGHVFDDDRYGAVQALVFDSLELTCEEFEDMHLTAYRFDLYAIEALFPNPETRPKRWEIYE